ncbi:DUF2304 domain-containing protein [Paenibacillus herberti]|uniref:DUF2304 domain-containing protein n=1 Tax=Paenibacillus herberti TaxID=1619309 RepID=A0A229NWW7_9BACL|nr:DUF2304 domain-containing protein [Paenibacillus herberti]OXM14109.1 hypothetical protein CGZ75_14120 [Paenibacillus herberti]
MNAEIYGFGFAISLLFVGTILHLIRKRKLREQYALLWLALGMAMMVLSLFPSLLEDMARTLHVIYAPSLLYFIGLMGVLFLLLHQTIAVSSLTQKLISLTQTTALKQEQLYRLQLRVEELEGLSGQDRPGGVLQTQEETCGYKRLDDSLQTLEESTGYERPAGSRHKPSDFREVR